jgi:hypothetical protein
MYFNRAELGGLIAILYTIYRICKYQQVSAVKFKYHCDNKGVLTYVFSHKPATITQFLHDFDLVQVAKTLVTLIPVTIVAEWVKVTTRENIGSINTI